MLLTGSSSGSGASVTGSQGAHIIQGPVQTEPSRLTKLLPLHFFICTLSSSCCDDSTYKFRLCAAGTHFDVSFYRKSTLLLPIKVHFPSNPLQPGPIYFLTPRKCGIFGICREGVQEQVNNTYTITLLK